MPKSGERAQLGWQERQSAFEYWIKQGFTKRHANGLVNAGFATLDQLQVATDFDLSIIANVGTEGRAIIYRLLGRKPPGVLRPAAEVRDKFESMWRVRFGDERFNHLVNEIVELAGNDLDKANIPAAQALWGIARRRRAQSRDSET